MQYNSSVKVEITSVDNVTMLTFSGVSANAPFGGFSEVFKWVANAGINVDMISQTPPRSDLVDLAFTVSDDDFAKLIPVVGSIKQKYPHIIPLVSSGNVKLRVYSADMIHTVGMAARIFEALDKSGIQSLLITTSETDVSVLVAAGNELTAIERIQQCF